MINDTNDVPKHELFIRFMESQEKQLTEEHSLKCQTQDQNSLHKKQKQGENCPNKNLQVSFTTSHSIPSTQNFSQNNYSIYSFDTIRQRQMGRHGIFQNYYKFIFNGSRLSEIFLGQEKDYQDNKEKKEDSFNSQLSQVRNYFSQNFQSQLFNQKTQEKNLNQNKGLKQLSIYVKEIVEQNNGVTQKQVADIILKDYDWQENKKDNKQITFKEEQNIKRRVYDALNVLISAEMITKKDKKVFLKQQIVNKELNEKYKQYKNLKKTVVSQQEKQSIFRFVNETFLYVYENKALIFKRFNKKKQTYQKKVDDQISFFVN